MASPRPPRPKASRTKPTIKYGWSSLEADETLSAATAAHILKPFGERSSRPDAASVPAPPQNKLSTTELVSAVGGVWRAVGYRGENPREECSSLRYVGIGSEENGQLVAAGSSESCKEFNLKGSRGDSVSDAGADCEQLKVVKKCLLFGLSGPFLLRSGNIQQLDGYALHRDTALQSCCGLGSLASSTWFGNRRSGEVSKLRRSSASSPDSNPLDLSGTKSASSSGTAILYEDSASKDDVGLVQRGDSSSISLHAADPGAGARNQSLSLYSEVHVEPVVSASVILSHGSKCVCVESSGDSTPVCSDGQSHSSCRTPPVCFAGEVQLHADIFTPVKDRLSTAFANKKHALAGALAGTFVSLCLHPVDTVKTVIQARSMHSLSFCSTFRSIISERGVMGLYRGIASNIASSAPTSAVYTFTYETVKTALLPHLPKECNSFAHCTAGGCASIATSFIFTPSERIKQQMQIRSHYQNCWTALLGILENGGFRSLYAGWSAVLCRNIPHSIIKFYTYEKLKQLFLPSSESNVRPSTLQTLVCGGLAGSTAALFTTPFDVVKTRLQTQVPGSIAQYSGVFHALKQIANDEGLSGLYRGLSPRLAMYVSQGAIFFASYEFFKSVFSLEVSHPCSQPHDSINIRHDREHEPLSQACPGG